MRSKLRRCGRAFALAVRQVRTVEWFVFRLRLSANILGAFCSASLRSTCGRPFGLAVR